MNGFANKSSYFKTEHQTNKTVGERNKNSYNSIRIVDHFNERWQLQSKGENNWKVFRFVFCFEYVHMKLS